MARVGLVLVWLLPLTSGCSRREVEPPRFDARAAAARALAEYDTNQDGFLDVQELERCPGLKSCLRQWDRDKDGRLSLEEVEAGLEALQQSGVGLLGLVCRVQLDGRPLPGASVVLEPEPFLAPELHPARATTDEDGRARPQADGAEFPGCQLGLYRVRISKTEQGREVVPPRYNRQSRLGIGVGPEVQSPVLFPLSSR
jgi:hypothetical protein